MKVMIRLKWEDDEMILREALEKNNSDAIIDEIREELGLEKETENEKKLREENFQKMCEKNDKENKKIFGEDYSSIFKN